jgi:hypothetical protein
VHCSPVPPLADSRSTAGLPQITAAQCCWQRGAGRLDWTDGGGCPWPNGERASERQGLADGHWAKLQEADAETKSQTKACLGCIADGSKSTGYAVAHPAYPVATPMPAKLTWLQMRLAANIATM